MGLLDDTFAYIQSTFLVWLWVYRPQKRMLQIRGQIVSKAKVFLIVPSSSCDVHRVQLGGENF